MRCPIGRNGFTCPHVDDRLKVGYFIMDWNEAIVHSRRLNDEEANAAIEELVYMLLDEVMWRGKEDFGQKRLSFSHNIQQHDTREAGRLKG